MRSVLLLALAVACWTAHQHAGPCSADADAERRVRALTDAVLAALDRAAVVERTLAEHAERVLGPALPSPAGPEAGLARSGGAQDAGLPEGWQTVGGLPFPIRGRFKHHHSVVESGPPSEREVSAKGLYLLKQTT